MTDMRPTKIDRRKLLMGIASLALTAPMAGAAPRIHRRSLADVELPAIGMGTWITFDVGADRQARAARASVLDTFFELGGALVDSSPMYRSAEAVVGHCLAKRDSSDGLYAATKVWKYGRQAGVRSMAESLELWGLPRFDLIQIHNMLDWHSHLGTLVDMRDAGRVRHIGITTSHRRRHADMESVIAKEPAFDAVQFTYNVTHREAEAHLLPLAREHGKAVIVNRPLDGGRLFDAVADKALPGWAKEIECTNWAQVFLKFVISHPAVTCAIPATSRVDHMRENMGALHGPLPDAGLRKRIVAAVTL